MSRRINEQGKSLIYGCSISASDWDLIRKVCFHETKQQAHDMNQMAMFNALGDTKKGYPSKLLTCTTLAAVRRCDGKQGRGTRKELKAAAAVIK
jgi:hypothetical protein